VPDGGLPYQVAYQLRELRDGFEYLVQVEEDGEVLEQSDQHPEEEAGDRARQGRTEEEGEEARDELAYAGSDKVVPDETTYDGAYGLGVY
jgi:hypothetical protein